MEKKRIKILKVIILIIFLFYNNQICGNEKIKSYKELKYLNIDRQMAEFSCGIAVLATIFTYYFDIPIKEEEIAKEIFKKMVEEKRGISFLDMKKFAIEKGFQAYGYKMNYTGLLKFIRKSPFPMIIHTKEDFDGKKGFHFSILVGKVEEYFILKDTSLGNKIISGNELLSKWTGYVLVIIPPKDAKKLWEKVYEKVKNQLEEKANYISIIHFYENFSSFYIPSIPYKSCW
jgi:hypothetical protein